MKAKTQTIQRKKPTFRQILKKLFSAPSIVLIGSWEGLKTTPWKTGKTDFFLLIAERLLEMGVVDEVATNINTFGAFPYIHDLQTLKLWLSQGSKTKLFGLDEANIHLPSRRAMSNKSVDILQIFPEISKARARLVVIGQKISSLDSELRTYGWVRGRMYKIDLKTVHIFSSFFRNQNGYKIHDLPRTSVKFDPYLPAPFTIKPTESGAFQDVDFSQGWEWCNGNTPEVWGKHPMAINRQVKKGYKRALLLLSQLTSISVGGNEIPNSDSQG